MTALKKYARLEATGLWRPSRDAQRREVFISIGEATLVISDMQNQPLTHWSLAAIERANGSDDPAIFHPDGDPNETLELAASEAEMTQAIDTLRRAIDKSRPRPGRLRGVGLILSLAAVIWLAIAWLPGALQDHTLTVVPQVKRDALGQSLLTRIERVSGPACKAPGGLAAMALLSSRLEAGPIAVLPALTQDSLHLPGNLILLNHSVIEDHEDPDITAGYIVTEQTRRDAADPLRDLLNVVGLRENFRLLTTGNLSDAALDTYAEYLTTSDRPAPDRAAQIARFAHARLRSTPFAYAQDITGETTLPLIEGDPMAGKLTEPLITDANWLRLQTICGG